VKESTAGGIPLPLAGETAIVTGAGRGIGRAIALSLAGAGARVVLASRTKAQVEETAREAEERGGKAIPVAADVATRAGTELLVARALDETGRLDVVVNNAGVFVWRKLEELDEADWDRVLDTNLKSAYLLVHAAIPALRKAPRGRIVNVASIHGSVGDANVVAHCAAKFGLIGFTKALALELRDAGIAVNAVSPGTTDGKSRDFTSARAEPLREKLSPHDVAAAVLFLASPAAAAISGAVLDVWGGTHVTIKG
jgi:NAD(P)-dependent dehydrogenase (short-subunit alcohol dehydrogenase family)